MWSVRLAGAGHHGGRQLCGLQPPPRPAIGLEVGDVPYAGVPCWTAAQRWAHVVVPVAYAFRYATEVRPPMPHNPISLKNLVRSKDSRCPSNPELTASSAASPGTSPPSLAGRTR